MTEDQQEGQMVKSVRAIFAGLFVVVFLSEATDYGLALLGVFPTNFNAFTENMLIAATVYRAVYAAIGGTVAAWYAPDRPATHAAILAAIGFALGVLGTVANWSLGHHWYPIALAVTGPLCTVAGGWLRARRWRDSQSLNPDCAIVGRPNESAPR